MTHFEKVSTGYEVRTLDCAYACTLRTTSQSRAGLGAWPVAFDAGPSQTLTKAHRGKRQRRENKGTEGAETSPTGVGPAGLWPGKR